jgi:hypothetical protein
MTITATPKSRYAYRILQRIGIFAHLDHTIAECCADAFREQYNSLNHYDEIEPYNTSGYIYFLRSRFDSLTKTLYSDNDLNQILHYFEHGADTKLQYEFRKDYSATLSFSIRDRYIRRTDDFFRLILNIHIDDFRNDYTARLDAYTQPIIDDEDEVLATIMWHDLLR